VREIAHVAAFFLACYTAGQTARIAWRSRPMPWHQIVRFLALGWFVGVVAVIAAWHWDRPISGYTICNLIGVLLAAIGVRFMPTP
jgi:hypothetical protein